MTKLHLYGIFDKCCHDGSNIEFVENRDKKGWYQCKVCKRMFEGKMKIDVCNTCGSQECLEMMGGC